MRFERSSRSTSGLILFCLDPGPEIISRQFNNLLVKTAHQAVEIFTKTKAYFQQNVAVIRIISKKFESVFNLKFKKFYSAFILLGIVVRNFRQNLFPLCKKILKNSGEYIVLVFKILVYGSARHSCSLLYI